MIAIAIEGPLQDDVRALIAELNATLLHCLGIDHRRFTFKSQGLDQRLTGVEEVGVIKPILV